MAIKKVLPENIITCQQYDKGIKVFINITKDGLVESIAGSTIFLGFKDYKTNVIYNREMTITDAELGEVMYEITDIDTSKVGTFNTEIEITYSNGVKLSKDYNDTFVLIVTPQDIERI